VTSKNNISKVKFNLVMIVAKSQKMSPLSQRLYVL